MEMITHVCAYERCDRMATHTNHFRHRGNRFTAWSFAVCGQHRSRLTEFPSEDWTDIFLAIWQPSEKNYDQLLALELWMHELSNWRQL
jgi:hypothetical protein